MKLIVIGAGVAGLTAAALLARADHDVTVLEAHVDPGGCAATYFYKNYHFDAGATLVGGFQPGGSHDLVAQRLGIEWPVHRAEPALVFHSPDGTVTRWGDEAAWAEERQRAFGAEGERFWRTQEWAADQLWRFAATLPPWPPRDGNDMARLAARVMTQPSLAALAPLLVGSVGQWMRATGAGGALLRQFVDAQLLISAQVTAPDAAALFGAVALDLARAGTYHVRGGVGGIAETLAARLRELGGTLITKATVTRIEVANGRVVAVETAKKGRFEADRIIANLTPWDVARLLGEAAPPAWTRHVAALPEQWGAFMLYLGVDTALIPDGLPAHHQVVVDPSQPLGEGNSVFLSISPAWDAGRAPPGQRAITVSTHTRVAPWWALREAADGGESYEARVADYQARLLCAIEPILPKLRQHLRLTLPATPVTFQRYTRRHRGYVGGFPQRSILTAFPPQTPNEGLWLVGDSIFPGQSTAGVSLGAMRVAGMVNGSELSITNYK